MGAKNEAGPSALQLAYKMVLQLGYTHAKIIETDSTLTYKTLRRIARGTAGRTMTDRYYLKVLVSIINNEYERRTQRGGDGTRLLLIGLKNILLASL